MYAINQEQRSPGRMLYIQACTIVLSCHHMVPHLFVLFTALMFKQHLSSEKKKYLSCSDRINLYHFKINLTLKTF